MHACTQKVKTIAVKPDVHSQTLPAAQLGGFVQSASSAQPADANPGGNPRQLEAHEV